MLVVIVARVGVLILIVSGMSALRLIVFEAKPSWRGNARFCRSCFRYIARNILSYRYFYISTKIVFEMTINPT